jgi:hypothetical protein
MTVQVERAVGAVDHAPSAPHVGQFVWADLMTTDPTDAMRFYGAVTGWTTTPFEMGGPLPYQMWTRPGGGEDATVGGTMGMPAEAQDPPHWLPHLAVADCAAATAHAVSLGATVLQAPMPIPTVGEFSIIRDPQGAVVSLFAPSMPMPKGVPPVGDFGWFELATSDRAGAVHFYGALVGWAPTMLHDMGGGMHYQLMRRPGDVYDVAGIYQTTEEMPMPPAWTVYVRVADLDAAVGAVAANGGTVVMGPMDVPGGDRVAMATDPQGAMFGLIWSTAGG